MLKRLFLSSGKWIAGSFLLLIFLLQGIHAIDIPFFKKLEGISADLRLNATLPLGIDERIVIADIDEASLSVYGQWPWNRHHLADLMDVLFDHYQINAIGFDMVFAEPAGRPFQDLHETSKQLSQLTHQHKTLIQFEAQQDEQFSKSLLNRNITSGIFFQQQVDTALNQLPSPIASLDQATHEQMFIPKPQGYTANLPNLQQASLTTGFFDNPSVDPDGNFRRVPLLQSFNGHLYPSLAMSLAQLALGNPPLDIQLVRQDPYLAIESVQVGHRIIKTDASGAVQIPFRGPEGSFPYVSVKNILNKTAELEALKGKILLLGTSAPGLLDLRSTPVDESMPGVEVHANIVAGILDQNIPQTPAYTIGAMLVLYFVVGLLLLVLPHFLSPFLTLLLCLILGSTYLWANLTAWQNGLIFPLSTPLLLVVSFFIFHMSWGFFVESKKKRAITRLFGQYVPPELVDEMAKQPESISLEGESKNLTVLFSDVRNFTSISETLEPKALTQLMNDLLTPMTHCIYEHRGTVDKYMGDAIMAFWGAPLAEENHAHLAVSCALDMQTAIHALNKHWSKKGLADIKIGVGLNTGTMSVGNMGSEYRMAYTVMGDAVNLGSRLEGLSKVYGADIVVSEETKNAAPDFLYRPLDCVKVKGKQEAIKIYEPLMTMASATDKDSLYVKILTDAFSHYCQQSWQPALVALSNLETHGPDHYHTLINLYRSRIQEYQVNPPGSNWNGVFTHTSK